MLRTVDGVYSSIHTAGRPGAGLSDLPKALVLLVNTTLRVPASAAASSTVSVPVTLVSTKSWRLCEPTCGLCRVAVCRTWSAPWRARRTASRSSTEPTTPVNGEARTSRPTTWWPWSRRVRASASPRWPALPVTQKVAMSGSEHGVQIGVDGGRPGDDPAAGEQRVVGQAVVAPPARRLDDGERAEAVPGVDVRLDVAEQPPAGHVAEAERRRSVAVEHPPLPQEP